MKGIVKTRVVLTREDFQLIQKRSKETGQNTNQVILDAVHGWLTTPPPSNTWQHETAIEMKDEEQKGPSLRWRVDSW